MERNFESNLGVRRLKLVVCSLVLLASLGVTLTLAVVELPQGGKVPMVVLGLMWSAAVFALFWVRNLYVRAAAAAMVSLMLIGSFNSPGPSGESPDEFLWSLVGAFAAIGAVVPALLFVGRWVLQGFKAPPASSH